MSKASKTQSTKGLIDTDIVGKHHRTGKYSVKYFVYRDDSKRLVRSPNPVANKNFTTVQELNGVCFSGLLSALYKGKKEGVNRVSYTANPDVAPFALTPVEKEQWIRMCKKHGLLPAYTPLACAKDYVFVVKVDESLPVSLLYCHMCCFRSIVEMPDFVRAMVYLVNKIKMNFFAAWLLASKTCVDSGNSIHHVGEWSRNYMTDKTTANDMQINLAPIVSLFLYTRDPSKYDKRGAFSQSGNSWCCGTTINNAYKGDNKTATLSAAQILHPQFEKMLLSGAIDKESLNIIKNGEDNGKNKG